MSKAYFRSIKTPTVDLQLSVALVIYSTSSTIAKDVDIFCLNPYWVLYNICENTLSNFFENGGSKDTGL